MASYPQSLARIANPQMTNSQSQPKPVRGKMGLQNAASRRLQRTKGMKKPMQPLTY